MLDNFFVAVASCDLLLLLSPEGIPEIISGLKAKSAEAKNLSLFSICDLIMVGCFVR